MAELSAIILAAGTSSRMGETNKLFLDLKGKPMIKWVIVSVVESRPDEIIVVANDTTIDKLGDFKEAGITLVENHDYQSGMTSSIQTGVRAANTENGLMICLGDLPLIKTSTYDQLITTFEQYPDRVIVPRYTGQKGNPVIFPAAFRNTILNHSEPEGCKEIVQTNKDLVMFVDVDDEGILRDVDTPEQYLNLNI